MEMVGLDVSAPAGYWSFADVEERLIEALQVSARLPDPSRHAAWLSVSVMSLWQQTIHEGEAAWANYAIDACDDDADRRPLRPGRDEIGRAEEVERWVVNWVGERDRKLLGLAAGALARGASQVPWRMVARAMGWGGHEDTLRKRYGAALSVLCMRLNARTCAGSDLSTPRRKKTKCL